MMFLLRVVGAHRLKFRLHTYAIFANHVGISSWLSNKVYLVPRFCKQVEEEILLSNLVLFTMGKSLK